MEDQSIKPSMFCYKHVSTTTNLTCVRCEKPICTQCMTRSPVGFRCIECAKPNPIPAYQINLFVLSKAFLGTQLTAIILGILLALLSRVIFFDLFMSIIVFSASSFLITGLINKITNHKKGAKLQIIGVLSIATIYLIYNLFNPYLWVSEHILALLLASYVCYIRLK